MAYPSQSGASVEALAKTKDTLAEGQKALARNQGKILDNLKTLTKSQAMTLSAISKQGDRMDQRFDSLEGRLSVVEEGVKSQKSDMRTVKRALLDINVSLVTCPKCSEKFVLLTSPRTTVAARCPHCQYPIGVADCREKRR